MASPMPVAGLPSGTYKFAPDIASLVRDAYSRIQIYPPEITNTHMVSARTSLGLMLMDASGNRGPNLWAVDQICLALTPGQLVFPLPANTIDLLDCYLRTFTPQQVNGVNVGQTVGAVIVPLGPPNNPAVGQPIGDPALLSPPSGTFTCSKGSQFIKMRWPAHGQVAGNPIFWNVPASVGGQVLSGFSVVTEVIDSDTVEIVAPLPCFEDQTNQGATPLIFTTAPGATFLNCILPGHGLSVGSLFTVPSLPSGASASTLIAAGTYPVTAVASSYQFSFAPPGFVAPGAAMNFMNNGQFSITTQMPTQQGFYQFQDVPLFPLSRTDYVGLSVKNVPGRPTSYWLDRVVPPQISIYPVAPIPGSAVEPEPGIPTEPTLFYAFMAYRMREIQDAIPVAGQVLDAPRRMWPAIVAELCAMLAEKWRPEQWQAKVAAATLVWDRASSADVEHVTTHITPSFSGYFR